MTAVFYSLKKEKEQKTQNKFIQCDFCFKSLAEGFKNEFGFDHNAAARRFVAKRMSEIFKTLRQTFETKIITSKRHKDF